MAYEVTATRKRPSTFHELAGQEFVASSLSKSVKAGKIAHAYLFSGPRGVGKTSAARILAKAVNCETWPAENPCCKCESCLSISRGNAMDVIEIDGASNTSVNDIREIKDEVLFAPNSSRYKVYIIDEVHMLSNSAFNALLKTIEEPPPYIIFIFATTEIHKVPPTIKSRCQQFNFRLLDIEILKSKLKEAADENGVKAEDEALFWIARESTGSLRDAYTLFDQAAAFSDNMLTLSILKEKLGLVGLDEINELAISFGAGNSVESLGMVTEILKRGISAEQFLIEMAEYFRNILLLKHDITKEGILGFPCSRFSEKVIDRYSVSQLEYALSMILSLYRDLRYSLNPRFEIELLVSRFLYLDRHISDAELLERIAALKNDIKNMHVANADFTDTAEAADSLNVTENFTNYRDILSASIKKHNMLLASSIAKSRLWQRKGENVIIYCDDKFSADNIIKGLSEVKAELDSAAGGSYRIEVTITEKEKDNEEAEKTSSDQVDLIRKVFKGEVVETRKIKEKADEY